MLFEVAGIRAPGPVTEATPAEAEGYWKKWLGNSMGLVVVDLDAPIRDIESSFKRWVQSRKPAVAMRRPAMTNDDLQLWCSCRAIAYIDIDLWRKATGRKLRVVDIANAIFSDLVPDAGDKRDRLEKATEKHARRIMSDAFFTALSAQFYRESGTIR